ncbi:putative Ran-specific GTPase-activating protein [Podospora fimiseda]|uniref:Ran-specific GTPase-activating protein n=1 Tax=Podospora fimiseda TaxID=252190 RepID=A0AAN7BU88_9PEZI|nr:putative Ran-specific GTPase-activating protein [Podospora fimiseda]
MDKFLQAVGGQTVNFVVRSGIALTSKYAVQQCSRLLKTIDDKRVYAELKELQKLLNTRIKIVSPAIELIQLKSGRGNSVLDAALPLATALQKEIIRLGKRLQDAAAAEEVAYGAARAENRVPGRMSEAHHAELLLIIADIKRLLDRIDRDIPLIQLAISTSGQNMNTPMSGDQGFSYSPSRLMQASTLVSFGDLHFTGNGPIQVGPSFTLTLYMLFLGHAQGVEPTSSALQPANGIDREIPYGVEEGGRKPIWQEVMHKARVRLLRTPVDCVFDPIKGYHSKNLYNGSGASIHGTHGYSYHLEIVEDLDDGRVHDENQNFKEFEGVKMAGIRESIPIYQFAKIFYTDTGVILNIGDPKDGYSNPVLLLKRDLSATSPLEELEQPFSSSGPTSQRNQITYDAYESDYEDDQEEINRQLLGELPATPPRPRNNTTLPGHLDPEWLALEVLMDDDDTSSTSTLESDSEAEPDPSSPRRHSPKHTPRNSADHTISSDSSILRQLRDISLHSNPSGNLIRHPKPDPPPGPPESPFGTVTSSLSLLEMLIRLTSLRSSQQTTHLAIPDEFTIHFLENTSTTGLQGEQAKMARREARRRMGFDPYDADHGQEEQETES